MSSFQQINILKKSLKTVSTKINEDEKVAEYEEDDEYSEEYNVEKDEEDEEEEEEYNVEDDVPISTKVPTTQMINRERKRKPVEMDIRQYDILEMRIGEEKWLIKCYSEVGFGAFEVIEAPYRRDLEGYIFRKGDRYGGKRPIISPINFIFQLFVKSAGIRLHQKRTPWTCIYKLRDGVVMKLDWV